MKKKTDVQRRAVSEPRLTITDLARAIDVSPNTVKHYNTGRRRMPEEVRERLADFLQAHGKRMIQLARELRKQ
jgi:DNA-binding LacI/PurR family transcriptional regulator